MIKILHCELDSNVGGIESFLKNLSKSIDYSEVQFDFLTKCSNPAFKSDFESLGCNIIKVPADVVRYCCSVKRILSEGEYNIIHIHKNSAANIILPVIVKTTSAVMIIHSHNTKPSISNILTNILHAVNLLF